MEQRSNGFLIKQIHDSLEKQANNSMRPKGLTMMQVAVLMSLRESEAHCLSMKELEHRFQVAQSTAAGIVSRLEQKGLVEAMGDPTDRRVKLVCITPGGEECCVEAAEDMRRTEERLLRGFSPEERAQLNALLTRSLDNIS